jgi:hypothetical protein
MTEAEILNQIAIFTDRSWNILQWWAGITTGVLLAAHFGSNSLNKRFVILIATIYSLFSIALAQSFLFNSFVLISGMESLANFVEQSEATVLSQFLVDNFGGWRAIVLVGSFVVAYIGTIYYLMYSYNSNKQHSTSYVESGDGDT